MRFSILIPILLFWTGIVYSGDYPQKDSVSGRIKVYLDCRDCNSSFIHRNLTYADFVRDPKVADIHIFVTEQKTASNGADYGINFLGMNQYSDLKFKLNTVSPFNETDILRWERLLKTLQAGLLPYVSRTQGMDHISIIHHQERMVHRKTSDPWNFWVFRLGLGSDFEAEERQREYSLNSSVKIDRINETWKLKSELYYELDQESYQDGDLIISKRKETGIETDLVYSLSPRWSIGAFGEISNSSYLNSSLSTSLGPAIEYNIFPWDKSDRKVFTLAYHLKSNYFNYNELTIFGRMEEWRASESLKLTFILRQPWGEIENSLEGSHYFHDLSRNRISLESDVSVMVARGLALFVEVEADIIHDQLYISAEGVSREEILLNQRKLETSYDLEVELGIRFTFGSIYNDIINERFIN